MRSIDMSMKIRNRANVDVLKLPLNDWNTRSRRYWADKYIVTSLRTRASSCLAGGIVFEKDSSA